MTSSDPSPKKGSFGRRIAWLAGAVLLAIVVYTAGWFYFATELENRTRLALAGVAERGDLADCVNAQARGYPFRIGLFCDRVEYSGKLTGAGFRATGLRSAAQVYNPSRIVGEMDEIAITPPLNGAEPLSITSKNLRFSALLDRPLPERASVIAREIRVDATDAGQMATASAGQAHMRRNGNNVDLAFSAEAIEVEAGSLGKIALPHADADLTVVDGIRRAQERPRGLRGLDVTVRTITVTTGPDSGLAASGPFTVDEDGIVDAQLQITFRNPRALAAYFSEIFPQMAGQITQVSAGLSFLGDQPTVPLTIERGQARIAFVRLGTIPPLD